MTDLNVAQHRPRFTSTDAEKFAADHFGLNATAAELPSDRDQNFLLTTSDATRFVLKLASAAEERAVLEAQHAAMRRVKAADLAVPEVIPNKAGNSISVVDGDSGRRHFLRMLSFLQGLPFASARPKSARLVGSAGRFVGRLSSALEGFDHAGAHRRMPWDLLLAEETVLRRLHLLAPDRRLLVEHLLRVYREEAAPHLPSLRRSIVHNDANDYNILVGEPDMGNRSVVGLIDFGDLVQSLTIADIAVAAAYVLLDATDPLDALSHLVAAYQSEFPLEEIETAVLYPLIALRLCTSICIAAEQQAAEPENAYLRISVAPVWRMLERLAGIHPHLVEAVVRNACGHEPRAESPAVAAWIGGHIHERAEVIRGVGATRLEFDFSVGSGDWSFDELSVPRRIEDAIAQRLRSADPPIGIGRYDEARLVYQGDQFAADGERRTVHLGVDLFASPGTSVRAPFDAVVHSVADNDRAYDYGPTVILTHAPPDGPQFHTLYGHLSHASTVGLEKGRAIAGGEAFATIGDAEENGGWAPHLHFQLITDLLGREGDFPGVARASLRRVWTSISPDPSMLVGLPRSAAAPRTDPTAMLERRRRHVGPSLSLSYNNPIALARGRAQYLYAEDGRRFLDTVNNVAHVGHCHPDVTDAAARGMRVLNTNTRYLYEELVRYAERLTQLLPEPLAVCYFVNSGSEANDLALRMARAFTGREDVVVLDGAYHGSLSSLVAISPYKFMGPGGRGKPATTHVAPMPDTYRGAHRGPDAAGHYARAVGDAADRAAEGAAAFVVEPVMSCGGQVFFPDGFLRQAFTQMRERGVLCIADEVQTGFGRVGETFWAFELQGALPDVVTMGKPIGNGHPLGAVVTTPAIAAAFDTGMEYFNTYGGNPVSCAVGLAVLDVMEQEALQNHALETGRYFMQLLTSLADRHDIVGSVRGSGLFIGIEMVRNPTTLEPAADETRYIVERMREEGILTSLDGPMHNVIKVKPPLVVQRPDVDRYVETLDEILTEDFVRARLSA